MECLVMLALIVVPVIIGWRLLTMPERRAQPMPVASLAGWLTLKPLMTTPLWFVILISMTPTGAWQPAHFLSILPGAGLSLLTVLIAWPHFTGATARAAWMLLGLDCLRWFNSFWLAAAAGWGPSPMVLVLIGILAPTIYALFAAIIVQWQYRRTAVRASI